MSAGGVSDADASPTVASGGGENVARAGAMVGSRARGAVEQAANMRVRLAADAAADLRRDRKATREQLNAVADRIEATIVELDFINQRAATPERLLLLGSACKRLAWVRRDTAPRVEALLNMAQYYREALDRRGGDDVYAFNNWAVACLLLRRLDAERAAIGDYVEDTWGSLRTLALFVASSLAGCLASLVWCESSMVVGASAGVLGQAGAPLRELTAELVQHGLTAGQLHQVALTIVKPNGFHMGIAFQGPGQAGGGVLTAGEENKGFFVHDNVSVLQKS